MTDSLALAPDPIARSVGGSHGDIFQLLRDGRPRTRAELASMTGLARSTVASRIDRLIASGLVGPVSDALSSGGRPASRFAFNAAARVVIAVDVGATHIVTALSDLDGRVLGERREIVDISRTPGEVLSLVGEMGNSLLERSGRGLHELAGVGIGLPGPVEHLTGRPASPPIMPGWDQFDVPGYINKLWTTPVLVDNDVNIMALGEHFKYWSSHENFLFIKVATGIGAGIISNGELQRGADGTAGDLGHVRVSRGDNVRCRCGNFGCLEALASGPAMATELSRAGVQAVSGSDILELAKQGNATALDVLRQAGRDIGEVVATCVNLLNPSVIVIGGGLSGAGDYLVAGIREIVYRRSPPLATAHLRVVLSQAGDRAGTFGAARMVTEHVLSTVSVEELVATQGL